MILLFLATLMPSSWQLVIDCRDEVHYGNGYVWLERRIHVSGDAGAVALLCRKFEDHWLRPWQRDPTVYSVPETGVTIICHDHEQLRAILLAILDCRNAGVRVELGRSEWVEVDEGWTT